MKETITFNATIKFNRCVVCMKPLKKPNDKLWTPEMVDKISQYARCTRCVVAAMQAQD